MTVQSSVGLLTAGGLVTYDVRTITQGHAADNRTYVSSKTGGKTFRETGNLDKTWEVTLYAPSGVKEMPAALKAGQIVTAEIPAGATSRKMLIDSSTLEVNIESGDLIGINLSLSAIDAASYT